MNAYADLASTYKVNRPRVVSESFGDETVLVNLDTGFYYSLQGGAGRIVTLIESGFNVRTVIDCLTREFRGDPAAIAASTHQFIADLAGEAVLVAQPAATENGGRENEIDSGPDASGDRPEFQPVIEKFSDMQDLLLLDPIHEVDQMGWPHLPASNAQ